MSPLQQINEEHDVNIDIIPKSSLEKQSVVPDYGNDDNGLVKVIIIIVEVLLSIPCLVIIWVFLFSFSVVTLFCRLFKKNVMKAVFLLRSITNILRLEVAYFMH